MNIKNIDRAGLRLIQERLAAVLEETGKELGVSLKIGRSTYDGSKLGTIKVEVATIGEGGKANSREADDFRAYSKLYGLDADMVGKIFRTAQGERYRLLGAKPRSSKYPILVERVATKKVYKLTIETVRSATFEG